MVEHDEPLLDWTVTEKVTAAPPPSDWTVTIHGPLGVALVKRKAWASPPATVVALTVAPPACQ